MEVILALLHEVFGAEDQTAGSSAAISPIYYPT